MTCRAAVFIINQRHVPVIKIDRTYDGLHDLLVLKSQVGMPRSCHMCTNGCADMTGVFLLFRGYYLLCTYVSRIQKEVRSHSPWTKKVIRVVLQEAPSLVSSASRLDIAVLGHFWPDIARPPIYSHSTYPARRREARPAPCHGDVAR